MGHYRIPKQPAIAPVLNQINSVYALPAYSFKIQFTVSLSSVRVSSKWPVFMKFLHQNPVCISLFPYACYLPCLSHPPSFHHVKSI